MNGKTTQTRACTLWAWYYVGKGCLNDRMVWLNHPKFDVPVPMVATDREQAELLGPRIQAEARRTGHAIELRRLEVQGEPGETFLPF